MSRRPIARLLLLLAGCAGPLFGQFGQVEATISDATVCEGDAGVSQAVFDVTVTFPGPSPGQSVVISYETVDGTATVADPDYVGVPLTELVFTDTGPGPQTMTVTVDVLGDDRAEGPEQFFVQLSVDDEPVTFLKDLGTATIQDDDDSSTLAIAAPAALAEGDAGATNAPFTVSLSPPSCAPVTLGAATQDGSATAGADYQGLAPGTPLVFSEFQASRTLNVAILGDTTLEGDESFEVVVSVPAAGALVPPEVRATATILDDDTVTVSIGDTGVFEDDAGTTEAGVPVQLSAPSELPVSVGFATRDGTATGGGDDYRDASGRVDFAPGETLKKVLVSVLGDAGIEPDEIFFIDLSSPDPAAAVLGDAVGTVTIRNDDAESAGVLRLVGVPEVGEGDGIATVTVERSGGAGGAAAVDFSTADDTATVGRDYRSRSRTLRWADGESGPKSVEVPILDDAEEEPDERFLVALSNARGATLDTPSTGAVVIRDDDQPTNLEPVGETARTSRVDLRLLFEVLASRADGRPVSGARVIWTITGDAELVGEPETATGADGIAGKEIVLGATPGRVTVTAEIPATGQTVTFEIVVEGDLDSLFDPSASPEESAVATLINDGCLDPPPALRELCAYVFGLEPAEQREVISELIPREAGALADLLLLSPQAQLLNLRRHLAARRGGGGGGNQITLDFGGRALPMGTFRVAISSHRAAEERLAARIGAAMVQEREEEAGAVPPVEIDAESRLGFFASGQVDVGDRPGSGREAGFELDTAGLTLGLDYRLRPALILGAAVGLVETDTRLEGDGGGTDVEGESLSLFLTWFSDKLWFDAILDYGRYDYQTARNLDLPAPFAGQRRLVASANPSGSQLIAELGAGYDATLGATALGLFGRLSFIDAELDAYTERGAGPFNLTVAKQPIESLLLEAGLELVYASSQSWGVLQPVLRASVLHEFEDDARTLLAGFVTDPGGGRFRVATDPPDRDYLRLGAGLTATLPRGRAVYLMYETDLERQDLDLYRLSGGLRLAF